MNFHLILSPRIAGVTQRAPAWLQPHGEPVRLPAHLGDPHVTHARVERVHDIVVAGFDEAEGTSRNQEQVPKCVASSSRLAIRGYLDTDLGTDVAGGMFPDFAGQGRAAATLVAQVPSELQIRGDFGDA